MKEIYKKISLFSFIGGVAATIIGVFYYLFFYESFVENGFVLLEIILIAVASLGASVYFISSSKQLSVEKQVEGLSHFDEESFHELNIQKVPAFVPKIYNVNSDGEAIFKMEPTKQQPFMRKVSFFKLFANGLFFPITYDILDMQNQLLVKFTQWTNGNRFVLTLYDVNDEVKATFVQRLTQSKLKNRGVLYNADGSIWRELEAKNTGGDIDVQDGEGRMTAFYRYGIFPYALKPAF